VVDQEKIKVLVVDDDINIVRVLTRVLKTMFDVFPANSGEEALTILRHNKIHVILSDQRMPSMTGVELLAKVKKLSKATVRILLTGYSESNDVVSSVNEAEIFRYVSKPWKNSDLIETVAEAGNISLKLNGLSNTLTTDSENDDSVLQATALVVSENLQLIADVKQLMNDKLQVLVCNKIDECLAIDEENPIKVILIELHLFSSVKLGFIKMLKRSHPHILVILVTSSERDSKTIIGLINEGQIYRYLTAPVSLGQLRLYLNSALQYQKRLRDQPGLLQLHSTQAIADKDTYKQGLNFFKKMKSLFSFDR